MKSIAVIPIVALCLVSCARDGQQLDVFERSIETEIVRLVGADAKVEFSVCERIDSTTFGEELEFRKRLIEARREQNLRLSEQYASQKKRTNARLRSEAAQKDAAVLSGIDSIRMRLAAADSLDIVCHYDYHVAGVARTADGITAIPDHYACVSADGTLLTFTPEKRKLHYGVGKVIPGYIRVLKGRGDEADS